MLAVVIRKSIFICIASMLALLLVGSHINVEQFIVLASFFLVAWLVYFVDPQRITEIKAGGLSIKSDVKKVRAIRVEIEQVKRELLDITKISAENAYILANSSFLAMGADKDAKQRLEVNLNKLSQIVEPIKDKENNWWKELRDLFPGRGSND